MAEDPSLTGVIGVIVLFSQPARSKAPRCRPSLALAKTDDCPPWLLLLRLLHFQPLPSPSAWLMAICSKSMA
jgi:hypothetical protein